MYIIEHNPFFKKTEIFIDSIKTADEKFSDLKARRFQDVVTLIPEKLFQDSNKSVIEIIFIGRIYEYEDFERACRHYEMLEGSKSEFRITHEEKFENIDVEKIKDLIISLKESPISELRNEALINKALQTLNNEFEIAVVATVSSGKSTLINAMLGDSLLPAKNEATTAKIYKIKGLDEKENFEMVCHFRDGRESSSPVPSTTELLVECNVDENIYQIDIVGNIQAVSSQVTSLVLIDTPGPNNAQDGSHSKILYDLLRDEENNPIILFILNATQMGVDADYDMLSAISEVTRKKNNEQTRERFIFVVNKVDELDEDETKNVIKKTREYLKGFEIYEANIFIISAERGLIMRKLLSDNELSKKEKMKVKQIEDLAQDDEYMYTYFEQYAPLANHDKVKIDSDIYKAKLEANWQLKALYHSGIPALEMMINDYVTKYAIPMKIQEVFKKIEAHVNTERLKKEFLDALSRNEERLIIINKSLQEVGNKLSSQVHIKSAKKKIEGLKFNNKKIKESRKKVTERFTKLQEDNVFKTNLKKMDAENQINKIMIEIEALQGNIKSELDNQLHIELKEKASDIIKGLESQILNAFENFEGMNGFDPAVILLSKLPNSDELIASSTVVLKSSSKVKIPRKRDRWDWILVGFIRDNFVEKDVTTSVSMSSAESLKKKFIKIQEDFLSEISKAEKMANEELESFKESSGQKIEEVLKNFTEYSQQFTKATSSVQELQQAIQKDKKAKEWMETYEKQKAKLFAH